MNAKKVHENYLVDLFANADEFEVKGDIVKLGYKGQDFYTEKKTAAKLLGIRPYETDFARAKLDLSVPKAESENYDIKSEAPEGVEEVDRLLRNGELKYLPRDVASGNERLYKKLVV